MLTMPARLALLGQKGVMLARLGLLGEKGGG